MTMQPVSVCQKVSWNGMPKASCDQMHRLGVERLADAGQVAQRGEVELAATSSVPSRISRRIAVGAEYQTVILCFCDEARTSARR